MCGSTGRLGQQPITDLLALLEAKGVRLFSLTENTASVNAFFILARRQALTCF